MKILIVNGSPRLNGNTHTALEAVADGIKNNLPSADVDFVDVCRKKIMGCLNCDKCLKNNYNCVLPDDTAELMDKVFEADVIIFGSPVYWMGISAQLKLFIDKFYSKDAVLHSKKRRIGIIAIGAAGVEDKQYRIIREQFEAMAEFLSWELVFSESIAAWQAGDLAKDKGKLEHLSSLWKTLEK